MKVRKKRLIALVTMVMMFVGLSATSASAEAKGGPLSDGKGSITVHKYETDAASVTPGDGTKLSDEDAAKLGKPLDGVGFTLYKIPKSLAIDDTKTPAEIMAEAKVDGNIVGGTNVATGQKLTVNGEILWGDLDFGYYVLVETKAPDGEYVSMPDAIISVPYGYTNESNKVWNENVHVYPKNVRNSEVIKEVTSSGPEYVVGDTVNWKITSKTTEKLETLKLTDVLDPRLDYTDGSDVVKGNKGSNNFETLIKGTDYNVTYTNSSNTVECVFTPAGVKKIVDLGIKSVTIDFATTINEKVHEGGGNSIPNDVIKEWKNTDTSTKTEHPPVIPEIKLGGIVLTKIDNEKGENKEIIYLDGAKFKVAASLADAKAEKFLYDGNHIEVTTGDNPNVAGTQKGWAMFVGLPIPDSSVDTEYFLVETKAPKKSDGNMYDYVLRPDIIKVTIPAGEKSVTPDPIKNTRVGSDGPGPIFQLPKTGGMGTILFIMAGLVLIGGAVTIMVRSRRNSSAK